MKPETRDVPVARPVAPTRPLTIIAQDPAIGRGGAVLTAEIEVPAERLASGPRGYRVHVVDFDASTDTFYKPRVLPGIGDDYYGVTDRERLVSDPRFHAQNVYAIVSATLARF